MFLSQRDRTFSMAKIMSSPRLLLLFLVGCLIYQIPSSESKKSLILPLRTQKIPSMSLPRLHPNKLRFHHNVSLTVTLAVGSPPQNVSMVLDTGSELSWLLCNATSSNTNSSSPATALSFRPNSSASYSPVPCDSPTCRSQTRDLPTPASCDGPTKLCHVSLSYADMSTSEGTLASDTFLIGDDGGSPPFRTVFGCMGSAYSSSSGEDPVTAGLLGMNRGALSFVTQTDTRRFSYCISDRDSSGVLLIGESNITSFLVPLNYTPLIQISLPLPYFDRVAYSVQLEGIRVGNVLLPIPKSVLEPDHTGAGQTMVDSGTQFTFLLGPAYDALKSEFLKQTKGILAVLKDADFVFQGAFDTCFEIRDAAVDVRGLRVPDVDLVLRGAEVKVTRERLLYRVGGGIWCLTFGNSDLVPMEAYVIGHHHQMNVWVEYDLERARVGFGPVQCDLASQRLGLVL